MTLGPLFPQPAVSVAVLITWLLAQNGISPGNVLLGSLLAVVLPRFSAKFWPEYPRRAHYGPLIRLLLIVLFDIVVANVRVAVLVLGPRRNLRPRFIEIPLSVQSPHAIALLASIISLTPGTVSSNLSGDRRTLLVHGLSVEDPERAVAQIKSRYESRVKEAFEC